MGIMQAVQGKSFASGVIKGAKDYENLIGRVDFFPWSKGSIVKLEVMGLPINNEQNKFFAFHIHENGNCDEPENNFPNTGEHFTKENLMHPNHTGDLPMIYSNHGYSFMLYYTSRFTPQDVVGKSAIIHSGIDDLKTQPSGNAGTKIACGVITKII